MSNNEESRPVITESAFTKYVDEMYDYGLTSQEVDETLKSGLDKKRVNPKGRDFDNEFVWNTSDRLDRALGLAQRRMTLVSDYKKRLTEVDQLLEVIRQQVAYGDKDTARTVIEAMKAHLATPVAPWAERALTTDFVLCAICRCDACLARIEDKEKQCCDHKDDTGSWGLPF